MFIVFEGIDGCGKSTHAKLLSAWMRESDRDVLLTAEPTKGELGALIRRVLGGVVAMSPKTLALVFTADRCEHVQQIRKALSEGKDVVCERYFYSTVAYQSAQGVDRQWLLDINGFAPKPDIVFFLDVDAKSAEERTFTGEIFEKKEFLEKVKKEYMKFTGFKIIDTSKNKEEVQKDIQGIVESLF